MAEKRMNEFQQVVDAEYVYAEAAICRKLKCNPKTLDDHLLRMGNPD